MAHADPSTVFRGYQDEIWQLMRGGEPLADVANAIEQTDVSDEHRLALWLLAFSLSEAVEHFGQGMRRPDELHEARVRRHHLKLVA